MEKELSHYLQNFAIQNQPSKRCASYPTLPYRIESFSVSSFINFTHYICQTYYVHMTMTKNFDRSFVNDVRVT